MLGAMNPVLDPATYVFCTFEGTRRDVVPLALALFREEEGLSAVLTIEDARSLSLCTDLPMRRIVLTAATALDGVGLTAAVAGELAEAGLPCNVIAAYHHDHLFVPAPRADTALAILLALQKRVRTVS